MADAPKYFAVLTNDGASLEAQAKAENKAIIIDAIVVGDGGGAAVTPSRDVTALVNQVHRQEINNKDVDDVDPNICYVQATIPMDVGGFWIRELGVMAHLEGDTHEVLFAYANHGEYYKLIAHDGQAVVYTVTIPILHSSDANVQILVRDYGYATISQFNIFRLYCMSQIIRLTNRVTQYRLEMSELIANSDAIMHGLATR